MKIKKVLYEFRKGRLPWHPNWESSAKLAKDEWVVLAIVKKNKREMKEAKSIQIKLR